MAGPQGRAAPLQGPRGPLWEEQKGCALGHDAFWAQDRGGGAGLAVTSTIPGGGTRNNCASPLAQAIQGVFPESPRGSGSLGGVSSGARRPHVRALSPPAPPAGSEGRELGSPSPRRLCFCVRSCPKRFPRKGWLGSHGILGPAQRSHVFRAGLCHGLLAAWPGLSVLQFCHQRSRKLTGVKVTETRLTCDVAPESGVCRDWMLTPQGSGGRGVLIVGPPGMLADRSRSSGPARALSSFFLPNSWATELR